MKRDDIIGMAHEAGIWMPMGTEKSAAEDALERFAALAAAAERRECARVCQEIEDDRWALYKGRLPYTGREPECGQPHTDGRSDGAGECAEAIRARSKP